MKKAWKQKKKKKEKEDDNTNSMKDKAKETLGLKRAHMDRMPSGRVE